MKKTHISKVTVNDLGNNEYKIHVKPVNSKKLKFSDLGTEGGKARAKALSPERRKEIAKLAVDAREKNKSRE